MSNSCNKFTKCIRSLIAGNRTNVVNQPATLDAIDHNTINISNISNTPIKHVILLMLENRSFDQIFGYRNDYPAPFKVNGIVNCNSADETTRNYNLDKDGNKIYQNPIKAFTAHDDATHDLYATLFSINGADGKTKNSGYVLANQLKLKTSNNSDNTELINPAEIMGYFEKDSFPIYEYIADNFTICDNWFASAPTCTLPNRAFGLCASSDGHINNKTKEQFDKLIYECDTIFDRLNDKNVSWKVYYNDCALSLVLEHQTKIENLKNYDFFSNFDSDVKNNNLPAFSFIEPEYGIESNTEKISGVLNGQLLVKNIISSLESNPVVWNSCLFVTYYDESGGFYDHVYPPPTTMPHALNSPQNALYDFSQYGNRVPALLVSPLIPKGVDSTLYDHTSLLSFIINNWNLKFLTERDKHANNFSNLILNNSRNDIPSVNTVNLDLSLGCNETTIKNRPMDLTFYKSFVEKHLINLLAEGSEVIYEANTELHQFLQNFKNKFLT